MALAQPHPRSHPFDVKHLMNSSMMPRYSPSSSSSSTSSPSPSMHYPVLPPMSTSPFEHKYSSPSPCSSPTPDTVLHAARDALQSKSIMVWPMEGYLFRTYRLQHTGGFFYILRSRPDSNVRLTRLEEERLQVEADVLRALNGKTAADLGLPRLIKFTRAAFLLGSSYLVSGPYKGTVLSDIEANLSAEQWASIDWSLGKYVREMALQTGPGTFGPVCSDTIMPGQTSWSRYFYTLIETVLRDAQDARLDLPYEIIRGEVRRHRASLDQITTPRLTLLELVAEKNLVVDTDRRVVAGPLDFATAVWGDPFLSDCFYRPTVAFAHGYGRLPNGDARERTRQFLYIAYHALVHIVRRAFRPHDTAGDFETRQTLNAALQQLMQMPA